MEGAPGQPEPAMAESRNQTRAGCLVHGQISAPELPDPIDCTIWDVSPEGARLILPEGASVPDEISISNPLSLNPWQG